MADPANKYPENVPGKYYVDDQRIDCDLCRETAPQISNGTMTADTPTSTNNRRILKRKRFGKKRWKAARLKPSDNDGA
jgi:hypothetical protein